MDNLSQLPHDVLQLISNRLKKLEDFVTFRCVSKSLYSGVKDEYFEGLCLRQRLPYFLLPVKGYNDNDDVRELYSLIEGESIVASLKIPSFKDKKCFESLGWLLTVEGDGNMALLDPFSGTEIPLPHQNTFPEYDSYQMVDDHIFIQKMVLSAKPTDTSDFILMVICGGCGHLAFWRLGDKAWNRIDQRRGRFVDVVHYDNGKFYAIDAPGYVWVFRLSKSSNIANGGRLVDCQPVVPYYGLSAPERPTCPSRKLYLLKAVDGSLLIITRTNGKKGEDDLTNITTKFQVYKVDRKKKTWKEIYNLGSMSAFVGHNSTIALDASRFPGGVIKANHIFFTDDDWDFYFVSGLSKGGGLNLGVYNMETGTIEPFYHGQPMLSKISTSLWINPPCL